MLTHLCPFKTTYEALLARMLAWIANKSLKSLIASDKDLNRKALPCISLLSLPQDRQKHSQTTWMFRPSRAEVAANASRLFWVSIRVQEAKAATSSRMIKQTRIKHLLHAQLNHLPRANLAARLFSLKAGRRRLRQTISLKGCLHREISQGKESKKSRMLLPLMLLKSTLSWNRMELQARLIWRQARSSTI